MRFRDVLATTRSELATPDPIGVWRLQSEDAKAIAEDLELSVAEHART